MYKKLSLSIALYGLLITPLSPLGVYESYNIVDFVNRNFQIDDQSKPNLVKTHYPLSYQSPNILTNIEGGPNSDIQRTSETAFESEMTTTRETAFVMPRVAASWPVQPKYLIKVISISIGTAFGLPNKFESIYIVKQVRVIDRNGRTGKVLYK